MARFQVAQRTTSGTNATAAIELIGSSTRSGWLAEVKIMIVAATASIFGLGRPAAKGITPTTPVNGVQFDPDGVASVLTSAVAWGTGPTAPTTFFERIGLPAAIGAGIIWSFPGDLDKRPRIGISGVNSLVVWNLGTNSVADISWAWDE